MRSDPRGIIYYLAIYYLDVCDLLFSYLRFTISEAYEGLIVICLVHMKMLGDVPGKGKGIALFGNPLRFISF